MIQALRLALLLACLLLGAATAPARILRVPSELTTVQGAIDSSADGDTVHVSPGTYLERLVIPDRNLTLASDDFFTQDSAAINTTILDGQWQGTVVRVNTLGTRIFRLEGFTVQRGMGSDVWETWRGGGITLGTRCNVMIRHVVFRENRAPSEGAAIRIVNDLAPNQVVLEDLHVHVDRNAALPLSYGAQIRVASLNLTARKWRFTPCAWPTDLVYASGTIAQASDIQAHGFTHLTRGVGILGQRLTATDIQMDSCVVLGSPGQYCSPVLVLNAGGDFPNDTLGVSRIEVTHCRNEANYGDVTTGILEIGGDHGRVDQITVRDCYSAAGTLARIEGYYFTARDFVFEDNVCGSDPGDEELNCTSDCGGRILKTRGMGLEDGVFRRNTSHVYAMHHDGYQRPQSYGRGLVLYTSPTYPDVQRSYYRRLRFEDNVVVDHDDYSNPNVRRDPNLGRAFYLDFGADYPLRSVLVEDCLFRSNREVNPVPEAPSGDPEYDGRQVGSTMEVYGGLAGENWRGSVILRNIVLEDNDDGGLYVWKPTLLDVRNIVVRNNGRMGLCCVADSLRMHNVLVEGTHSWGAGYSYPYDYYHPSLQAALIIWDQYVHDVSHVSLIDNHTEFVFWTNRQGSGVLPHLHNSIISGNSYTYFTFPWFNAAEFPPPDMSYTLSDNYQPGEGNLIGVDPGFHPTLGPPYLAADSPVIDAGDPDPIFNDAEDPANPGFALWPGQGSLRSDMGFTGGTLAAASDTGWVSVDKPYEPRQLPKDFSLGAAYPNPFNPVTRIPITLARPEIVKLTVHNLLGQEVAVLVQGVQFAGRHEVPWDAGSLASGVYVVHLEAGGRTESRAITLLR